VVQARVCKTLYSGSIPLAASFFLRRRPSPSAFVAGIVLPRTPDVSSFGEDQQGALAQRESACSTRKRSLVQSQYAPQKGPLTRDFRSGALLFMDEREEEEDGRAFMLPFFKLSMASDEVRVIGTGTKRFEQLGEECGDCRGRLPLEWCYGPDHPHLRLQRSRMSEIRKEFVDQKQLFDSLRTSSMVNVTTGVKAMVDCRLSPAPVTKPSRRGRSQLPPS
jgi:hypothetical protein